MENKFPINPIPIIAVSTTVAVNTKDDSVIFYLYLTFFRLVIKFKPTF